MSRITAALVYFLVLLAAPVPLAAGSKPLQAPDDHDFHDDGVFRPERVELGRLLFFDKLLSGNLNISCASCHHPLAGTGDGLSLPVGEGGRGLGVTRDTGYGRHAIVARVPRNAPALFNLGARQFARLFHDGRVAIDRRSESGFMSPAGPDLPEGLTSVLSVQAMLPVTSGDEMAGQQGENEVADAAARGDLAGARGVWALLSERLQAIPEYVELFQRAFPAEILEARDIQFVHAANAIADFEASAGRFDNSPFDRFLRGDKQAMSRQARRGMSLFYGSAGCDSCHGGVLQTDHDFHAIAMPQIGPGKGDPIPGDTDSREDFGRERVSGNPIDRYRFRTPSLRNVRLTAPYGHAGAYSQLEDVVRHHLDPVMSLENWHPGYASLPPRPDLDARDFELMSDPERRRAIADANELAPQLLESWEVDAIVAFLDALTDPAALDLRRMVPARVPSGLPVWD